MMAGEGGPMGLIWALVMVIVLVLPFWRICTKAGYPGLLSVLVVIPLVNIGFIYFLAFSRWPALRHDRIV